MRKSTLLASHVATFLAGVVLATAFIAGAVPRGASSDRYKTLDTLAQALSYIAGDYVETVDEKQLVYSAIRGMVHSLDKHSAFFSPARYQRLKEDTEGEFGGVGFELGPPLPGQRHPQVVELLSGSPAQRAGILEGDSVTELAGRATVPGSPATAAQLARMRRTLGQSLRGPVGSRLELVVARGQGSPQARTLVRERIKIPSVEWMDLPGRVGLIAIRRFQDATAADTEAALRALEAAQGGTIGVLILDLRDNPGGLFDQGVRVADLFVDRGVIVQVRARAGQEMETEVAQQAGTHEGFPMIVLINGGSASAAEIVAGALQDHGRATIVGLPSYGKASVQTFLDLADGSGLKLTTAHYVTPAGRSLDGAGIHPDVLVEEYPPEVISANSGQESRSDAAVGGANPGISARILNRVSNVVRSKLEDDLQFRIGYQMGLAWQRGNK